RPVHEEASAASLDALRGEVEAERRERRRLAGELARARSPEVNVPVVALSPATGRVVLALELDAPDFPRYRATLVSPDGALLWRGEGLVPDASGTLTV